MPDNEWVWDGLHCDATAWLNDGTMLRCENDPACLGDTERLHQSGDWDWASGSFPRKKGSPKYPPLTGTDQG